MTAEPRDGSLAGDGQWRWLQARRGPVYRAARAERQQRSGVIPLDRLPRQCPLCGDATIIGHGRRLRQAHDDRSEHIWVRRGICRPCRKTFTVLPNWLVPSGHYSLRCRQQACDRMGAGDSAEQAVPECKDPSRLPDPSTLRRWVQRRLFSLWCWIGTGGLGAHFLSTPTLLAWDLGAVCRSLRLEDRSP
jgi:Domain of unknown function (DUF6431)